MADAPSPLVTVRGQATLEVEPEVARLDVDVVAQDKDRGTVVRRLDERMQAVDALLEAEAAAIERTDTTAVRVSPRFASGKPREKVAGYEGSVHTVVLVTDFTVLGDLAAHLADNELTSVSGPWWSLRADSPVHRQVRVAAVHDAVRRAREYADALGATLTELVELADADLLTEPVTRQAVPAPAMLAFRGQEQAAPQSFTFDVSPARQLVAASVEARFHISAPDLTGPPSA